MPDDRTPTLARQGAPCTRACTAGTSRSILSLVVVRRDDARRGVRPPSIAPYDPDAVDLAAVYSGPTAAHWLGTDALGRDTLSRMIYGARTALLGPLLVVVSSTILGILLGLLAGWRGGWIDSVLGRIFDVVFAFPALLIAIMAVALFGKGLVAPVIAMSIAYAPFVGTAHPIARHLRAEPARTWLALPGAGLLGRLDRTRRVLPNVDAHRRRAVHAELRATCSPSSPPSRSSASACRRRPPTGAR